jgi:hypothetical protein
VSEAPAIVAFWRTRLGRAILGWIGFAVTLLVGSIALWEAVGPWSYVPWTIFWLLPPVLLIWSLAQAARSWRRSWPGPVALVAAAVAIVLAGNRLSDAGAYPMFWAQRAAFDRVVADLEAGRLPPSTTGEARRHGVGYWYAAGARSVTFEPWASSNWVFYEVFYDPDGCPGRNKGRVTKRRDAEGMLMISLGYSLHLGGHYCLRTMIV